MRKLVKASRLFAHAPWRHALLKHRVAASLEHAPLADLIEPSTILDVGANRGQFALWARSTWPNARIVAFEPIPTEAAIFTQVLPGATLHRSALGDRSGEAAIHLSARLDSSSLLPIGEGQTTRYPGTHEIGTMSVPVRRLDEVIDCPSAPALLKIDVQGYEMWTLMGAERLLPSLTWVYVECSERELYVGQALRDDLTRWLDERGFVQTAVISDRGIQSDILFSRAC